jgi:excinuclease ABC subunit A
MGPEGGSRGGVVVAEGTPEAVAAHPDSHTGSFLAPLLEGQEAKQPTRKRAAAAAEPDRRTTKKATTKKASRSTSRRSA